MAQRTSIYEFSEQERAIIVDCVKRELQGLTTDEMSLYLEWSNANAIMQAGFDLQQQQSEAITQAAIDAYTEITNAALSTLQAQEALALARLEAVKGENNG